MPVMAVLPLEFIEHQTSQCCEIWWDSGVSRFEHCISYAAVKNVFQAIPGFCFEPKDFRPGSAQWRLVRSGGFINFWYERATSSKESSWPFEWFSARLTIYIAFDIKETLATTLTLISPPNTLIDYYEVKLQGFIESKNTIRDGGSTTPYTA